MTGPAPGEPKYGGLLQTTVTNEPNDMDPAQTHSIHDMWQMIYSYDPLVQAENDLTLVPGLAESWDSPNNTTLIFHLQKNVQFHDGTPFNAEAVKFHFDRIFDPPTPKQPETQNQMAAVESWEVLDEFTIKINLSRPSASMMIEAFAERSGMVPSPTAIRAQSPQEFSRKPIATGPFKVVRWISGSHVEFEKNENYWREALPYMDRIRSQFNVDPAVEVAQFKTGELDILDSLPATEVPKWRDRDDVVLFSMEDPVHRLMQFNRTLEPWTNKDLRLALSYAVDREGFAQAVYQGLARPGKGVIHPSIGWAFDESWNAIKLNPGKVSEHLAKAGVELPFKFVANTHNRADGLAQATAVQASVNKYGFDMEINPIRAGTNSAMFHNEKVTPLYFAAGRSVGTDPNRNMFTMFHSKGRANPGGFVFSGLDELIESGDSTFDLAERGRIYKKIDRIVTEEEAFTVILAYNQRFDVMWDYVKNYEPHPHRFSTLNYARVWLDK
jgi:ABC-type transport system substrate-binding protein